MDPNQPAQSSENLPLRKAPHLPISIAETHPEIYNNDSSTNSKNTLLTLVSLLVLAGVVGITLWLYIQNRNAPTTDSSVSDQVERSAQAIPNAEQIAAIPTMTQEQQKETYGDVVCRRFTSIEEAIQVPEIACVLDLSGQNLTDLPEYITKLSKLNELNLSDNKFSEFPAVLYQLKSLFSINLENNQLNTFPDDLKLKMPSLQMVKLEGNKLSKEIIEKYQNLNIPPSPIPPKGSSATATPVKTSQ